MAVETARAALERIMSFKFGTMCFTRITGVGIPRAFSIFTKGISVSCSTRALKTLAVPVHAVTLMEMITDIFPGCK